MKKSITFVTIFSLFLAAVCLPAYTETGIFSIPDSSEIRIDAMEAWVTAPVSAVLEQDSQVHKTELGQVFQISSEAIGSELVIKVAPRDNTYQFPATNPGCWILYRSLETGKLLRIHVFFQNDPNVYIRLRPDSQPDKPKSKADLIIYGAYAARGVPIGLGFEDLAQISFSALYDLTCDTIPWNYVKNDSRKYVNNLAMIEKIRENLPRFEYIEDAGYDENENPVFISTGEQRSGTPGKLGVNCSGFTKWIIDGITIFLTGNGVRLDVLKTPTIDVSGTLYAAVAPSEEMFRSFDWIRNLSSAVVSAAMDKNFIPGLSGLDVESNPFASVETPDGIAYTDGFVKNAGYNISMLKSLFYVLAATEPDLLYLGAVKTGKKGEPETWTFHHDLAFFPYFDAAGICRIIVFESGSETDFDTFVAANPDAYVYLCRVKSAARFNPL